MEVKLNIRPDLEEISKNIKELETKYSLSSDEFEDQYAQGKLAEKEDFRLWNGLLTAMHIYNETGDLFYTLDVPLKSNSIAKVLSLERTRLFEEIRKGRHSSITDLSRKLKRDIKNVYVDLQLLKKAGMIKLIKQGKKAYAVAIAEGMSIEF